MTQINTSVYILKKLRKDSWAKIDHFEHTAIKYQPGINSISGRPDTGLKNPTKHEEAMNLSPGELKDSSPYWLNFKVIIDAKGARIDSTLPEGAMILEMLKNQQDVALGYTDLINKPRAMFILTNPEKEAMQRNKSREHEIKAMATLDKMTTSEKTSTATLYGYNTLHLSPEIITDKLFQKVKEDPQAFNLMLDDPDKETKTLIRDLVANGFLVIKGGAYLYNDNNLAFGEDNLVSHLKDIKSQELLIALKKLLYKKKAV